MNQKSPSSTKGLGLLANGSSRRWDIAVDESLDGLEWSLEIEGPQTYLFFQIPDVQIIAKFLHFLQSGPLDSQGAEKESMLSLGRFGSAAVSLHWDNEGFSRCFLIIGPKARSTLRLSFEAEDIQMLMEALRQTWKDLAQTARK